MAGVISPQPLAVGEMSQNKEERLPKQSYADQLRSKETIAISSTKLNLCPITVIHGEPTIEFTMDEVNEFTREEGLHQAAVLKFSYGKPDLQEIRRIFSTQFDVSGNCNIGQLEYRHLLVRFDLFSDYVQFISKSTGYLKSKGDEYFFRTFPWTLRFNPKEETSMAVVWISMPGLPPNFFAKRSIMSIASAVGKVLAVDKATQERTRPSTARVKVLLDLLDERPKKVKLRIVDKSTGKSVSYYQEIVYDNLPSYCCYCKHQGHDERACRILKEKSRKTMGATVGQNTNNLSIVDKSFVEQLKGSDLNVHNVVNLERLQGDARDFLNAKRAEQKGMEKQAKDGQQHDNITRQQLRQVYDINVEAIGIAANDPKDSTAGTMATLTTADNKASGKTVAAPDIPASTVFARMNKGIGHGNNVPTDHLKTVETPSYLPILQSEEQLQLNNNNRKPALHEVSKDLCKVDNDKGGILNKKSEAWTVITYRNSITKKATTGNLSPRVRLKSSGNVPSSNKFNILTPDKFEHNELAISNEVLMSKKLTSSHNNDQQEQGNDNMVVRHNELEDKRLDEHSSNVPTLHFSSPNVEQIIKDAHNAMLQHTNMGRQPFVTLNTSAIEIPSQSENSFDEYEGHCTQRNQSNGNKNELAPNLRELVSRRQENYKNEWGVRGTFWSEQGEDDEESFGDDEEEESTDYNAMESEDEETRSVASTQLPSSQKSLLNLNAPAFIPTKYGSDTIDLPEQNQLSIVANPVSHAQQQGLATGQQHTTVVSAAIHGNDQQHKHETGQQLTQHKAQQQLIDKTGQQQYLSIILAISLEDRRLLDALHDEKTPDKSVATKPKEDGLNATTVNQQVTNTNRLGRDFYEQGEEEEILQTCMVEAAKKGDLSPMHSGKKLKSHSRKKSWEGKSNEETFVRRLPMRVAKQKHDGSTISKTSTRSRNK